MKYILIISAVYIPEPIVSARLSADLYHILKEKGYEVKVLHPRPTRPNGFIFNNKTAEIRDEIVTNSYTCPQSFFIGRIRESYSFGKVCSQFIKDHKNELSCIYANVWPMFSQYFIVKTAKKYHIPCIIHVQDLYPESLTNKLNCLIKGLVYKATFPMDKYILRNCTKVIAISEKMKDYLVNSRNIQKEKAVTIVNWQDEEEFVNYHARLIPQDKHLFTFMYLGNIGPVAGVDLLIDAFIEANLSHARMVIAGAGSMKEKMKERVANYSNIEFWDVPNGKVPEIQAKADCMLLPIKKGAASSSIPSKLPAYMFSAKPIIGCIDSDSDTAEAIKNAGCGWVIEPGNIHLLAEKMRNVAVLNSECLKKYGQSALKYGLENFSKGKNLYKLVSLIQMYC